MTTFNSQTTTTFDMPKTEIVIPTLVHEKIMHWVQMALPHECSGLGVTKVLNGRIHIVDVVMCEQKNSGAATDLDPADVSKAMYKMRESDGELNFWWHSHANMSVFWSGTDQSTIAQIGRQGMCVAAVFNAKREVRAAIAAMTPIPFFIDEVKVKLQSQVSLETIASWEEEFNDNVKKSYYHSRSHGNGYLGGGVTRSSTTTTTVDTPVVRTSDWYKDKEFNHVTKSWEEKDPLDDIRPGVTRRTVVTPSDQKQLTGPATLAEVEDEDDERGNIADAGTDNPVMMHGFDDPDVLDYDPNEGVFIMKGGVRMTEAAYITHCLKKELEEEQLAKQAALAWDRERQLDEADRIARANGIN